MSNKLGLRVYGKRQEMVFLGREISEQRDYSDAIAESIDEEVNNIITEQYELVQQLLTENKDKLDLVAKVLLDVETLDADEFVNLIENGELPQDNQGSRPSQSHDKSTRKSKQDKNWSPPSMDLPPNPSPA